MVDKETQKLLELKAKELLQTKSIQEIKQDILSKVGSLPAKSWSYMNTAKQALLKYVYISSNTNIHSSNPLAFATRTNGYTGVYKVYVYPNQPNQYKDPLRLHEFGHIIFQHLSLQKESRSIIESKIYSYWYKIKDKIDFSEERKSMTESEIKSKWTKKFTSLFLNIAMDYEVNSKLYTEEEWLEMKKYSCESYCMASALEDSNPTELAKIYCYLFETDLELQNKFQSQIFCPCWPADKNLPLKLSYTEYIDHILLNLDDFLDNNNNSDNDEGDNEEEDGSNDNDNNDTSSDKLTTKDIEDLLNKYDDTDNETNSDRLKQAEGNNKYSPTGHSSKQREISQLNDTELEAFIMSQCFNKSVTLTKNDCLFYYNRKKYNNSMLISKQRVEERYRPGNIFLLVDVSGSVPDKAISKMVSVVHNISKKLGKKSRVIFWSTQLEGDLLLKHNMKISGNGGTYISSGIKYVREKYLNRNSNDKFIIISDYEDTLSSWYDELKPIKNDCCGICWSYNEKTETPYIEDSIKNKFFKKLPTKFFKIK